MGIERWPYEVYILEGKLTCSRCYHRFIDTVNYITSIIYGCYRVSNSMSVKHFAKNVNQRLSI